MKKSLLFLPDISGFTEFVQSTEVAHSQHVIAELLEILISSNFIEMKLAEIEGDALFFYKEGEVVSSEKLLAQIETMFANFYSHLKMLETNRICPCNACATASNLELKIIAHCGELEFIKVRDNIKPFGAPVIEAHRLMKNGINSDHYVLLSKTLIKDLQMPENYRSKLFKFEDGSDSYDGKEIKYEFALIERGQLQLNTITRPELVEFDRGPEFKLTGRFEISRDAFFEYISNFRYRHHWIQDVKFEFDPVEVTKLGSEHVCVFDSKKLNFITITKEHDPDELVYGEMTTDLPGPIKELYQFYLIKEIDKENCELTIEVYSKTSLFGRIVISLFAKKKIKQNAQNAFNNLRAMIVKIKTGEIQL